ncbi:hypothetical protein BD410DRAFT_496476 [Rickenella mellea]|uniref:Uncharacterized protein n=1 Tax=Rickenella mellea TaxID=50990 RepID=A0A4Y7PTX6_9AGAM|nr:hypothetical protein BD410DRAFT_496476 [Rickenella mellea]
MTSSNVHLHPNLQSHLDSAERYRVWISREVLTAFGPSSLHWRNIPSVAILRPLLLDLDSIGGIIDAFRSFRSQWAAWMLHCPCPVLPQSPSPTPAHKSLIFEMLCDATSHLLRYPKSTPDTQMTIFRYFDRSLRDVNQTPYERQLPVYEVPWCLFDAYQSTLYGSTTGTRANSFRYNRWLLHRNFFQCLRVVGIHGHAFDNRSMDVQVRFSDYCKVLEKALWDLKKSTSPHVHDDASSQAILGFIQRRISPRGPVEMPLDLTPTSDALAEHRGIVRTLLMNHSPSYTPPFFACIRRIANELGYDMYLDPLHELACYDI